MHEIDTPVHDPTRLSSISTQRPVVIWVTSDRLPARFFTEAFPQLFGKYKSFSLLRANNNPPFSFSQNLFCLTLNYLVHEKILSLLA